MAKDSQIDKKQVRKRKAKGQATPASDAQNNSSNAKKQSIENNDV